MASFVSCLEPSIRSKGRGRGRAADKGGKARAEHRPEIKIRVQGRAVKVAAVDAVVVAAVVRIRTSEQEVCTGSGSDRVASRP